MTPPRSNESRLATLESEVAQLKSVQTQNHQENRQSIHGLADGQQTIVEQNRVMQDDVTVLKTNMDMVVGSKYGKKGKLDEIFESIKTFAEESRTAAMDKKEQNWLYELGKIIVFGAVAAGAAHYAK